VEAILESRHVLSSNERKIHSVDTIASFWKMNLNFVAFDFALCFEISRVLI
jgi:hypothetical protein